MTKRPSRFPDPVVDPGPGFELCYECDGSRVCWSCEGAGRHGDERCNSCHGDGKCFVCLAVGRLEEGAKAALDAELKAHEH